MANFQHWVGRYAGTMNWSDEGGGSAKLVADAPLTGFSADADAQTLDQCQRLAELLHLVEEVIRAGLHASFAHGRQVVVRQHDDPHVPTVAAALLRARAWRMTPMPLPGRSSTSTTMAS